MGMGSKVKIKALSSGFVVTERKEQSVFDGFNHYPRTTAEPTLQGALTLAARALGYRGVIRFDDDRTVEVPVVGMTVPEVGIPFDDEEPPLRAGTVKGDKL
jgi:hypothetical protein